jgi:hypothetical protein
MVDDKRAARVRALLARADDAAASPAEAEACRLKAVELIAKYSIDQALLGPSGDRTQVADRRLTLGAPYAQDKAVLVAMLATTLGGVGVMQRGAGSSWDAHIFAVDADHITDIANLLLAQLGYALAAQPVPPRQHPRAYRRAFIAGWRRTVIERIATARTRAAAQTSAQHAERLAVVLADRADLAQRRMAEVYPRRAHLRTSYSSTGHIAGSSAGQRADVGGVRLSTGAGQLMLDR